MSGKKNHRSTNDYLQYLKGELSRQERHAFERGLEADPFEQEAMEGMETHDSGQVEQDLLSMHVRLRKRLSRRRRVAFYSIAATVASLLIVGTVFLKVHDFDPRSQEKELYPEESQALSPEADQIEDSESESPPSPEAAKVPSKGIGETKVIAEGEMEPNKEPKEESKDEMDVSAMAAPTPVTDEQEEEQITYLEAEAVERENEARAARTSKELRKSKKSLDQPVAVQAQEAPELTLNNKELEQMLSGKVSGIVISAEDQGPIPGAVVVNRDLKSGVFTDIDGRFGIPVEQDTPTTLVASFVGMETQEYQVRDGAHVELLMQPDVSTLDEVVVVGYIAEGDDLPTGSSFELYQAEEQEGAEYNVPEPSIGFKDYKSYMEENLRYPGDEGFSQKEVVVLKFVVTRAGEVEDIVALRSPGESFTKEASRLLLDGPAWNPASNEKGTRDQSVRMRIVFKR